MKLFAATVLLVNVLLAVTAQADVLVYSRPLDRWQSGGMSFKTNRDLGRAWINLEFWQSPISEDDQNERTENALVQGLSYDALTRSIVLKKDDGTTVVCASLVRHQFIFSWTSMDSTGLCGITRTEKVKKVVDDGTIPYDVEYLNIYFGAFPEGRRGD